MDYSFLIVFILILAVVFFTVTFWFKGLKIWRKALKIVLFGAKECEGSNKGIDQYEPAFYEHVNKAIELSKRRWKEFITAEENEEKKKESGVRADENVTVKVQ